MSDWIKSENIEVFPSNLRGQVPSGISKAISIKGKMTSELNFTNLVKSLVDVESFVISYKNETLRVIIDGYYFEIAGFSFTVGENVWLSIVIETGNHDLVNHSDQSSAWLDNANEFLGLRCWANEPSVSLNSGYELKKLQVVKNGEIVNRLKLDTSSIGYKDNTTTKSLKDDLDSRQYRLKNGNGIDTISNNYGENEIKLTDAEWNKLKALVSKGNEGNTLLYTDTLGQLTESTKAASGIEGNATGANIKSQAALIKEGKLSNNGVSIYGSNESPKAGSYHVGDIWLKY